MISFQFVVQNYAPPPSNFFKNLFNFSYHLYIQTFDMMLDLAAFQLLSLGTFPPGASRHMTAAVTFTTAGGGAPNDFNSVKLVCNYKVN